MIKAIIFYFVCFGLSSNVIAQNLTRVEHVELIEKSLLSRVNPKKVKNIKVILNNEALKSYPTVECWSDNAKVFSADIIITDLIGKEHLFEGMQYNDMWDSQSFKAKYFKGTDEVEIKSNTGKSFVEFKEEPPKDKEMYLDVVSHWDRGVFIRSPRGKDCVKGKKSVSPFYNPSTNDAIKN